MNETDPYTTPTAELKESYQFDEKKIERTALGQKLVIYAIVIYFVAIGLQLAIGPNAALLAFVSLALSLVGLVNLLSGMDTHIAVKVLLFVFMFVPLINLLTLVRMNARATKKLTEAGYKVGLFGARKEQPA